MTADSDRVADIEVLQQTLRAVYRHRVQNLSVTPCEGGVEIGGEASSYYPIQLVLRDVLAKGFRIRRNRIRVRRDPPHPAITGPAP